MRTAVRDTSILNYRDHKADNFANQHAIVLAHMRTGAIYSRRQLAKLAGMETSTMAGRVNELIASGEIEVCGTIKCPYTKRNVEGIKRVGAQQELHA